MKECYWCKKSCPDDEEGDFEVEPDSDKEVGWVCDHCVLAFDGKCDCEHCKAIEKSCQVELERYNLAHPKKKSILRCIFG